MLKVREDKPRTRSQECFIGAQVDPYWGVVAREEEPSFFAEVWIENQTIPAPGTRPSSDPHPEPDAKTERGGLESERDVLKSLSVP